MRSILLISWSALMLHANSEYLPRTYKEAIDPFEETKKATTVQEACTRELLTLCVDFLPESLENSFQARMCLRGNNDELSAECRAYLYEDSPSIVEPCFQEIGTLCHNVIPGNDRVLSCLLEQEYSSISLDCQTAIRDNERFDLSVLEVKEVLEAFLGGDRDSNDLDDIPRSSSDDSAAWPSGDQLMPSINSIFINTANTTIMIMCSKIVGDMLGEAKYIESLIIALLSRDEEDQDMVDSINSKASANNLRVDRVRGDFHYLRGSV